MRRRTWLGYVRRGLTSARSSFGRDHAPLPDDWERAACETEEAMRAGREVVYQAVLGSDRWRGIADFLLRVDDPSPKLGAYSYEVLDTKLARHAKPAYVLQLCFYSTEVGRIQGAAPRAMHVLLGNGEQESFRPDDFAAYARRVQSRVAGFLDEPARDRGGSVRRV